MFPAACHIFRAFNTCPMPLVKVVILGRGLHSFTFQLNIGAFCGIGGALWGCLGINCGCLGGVGGMLGGVEGCKGCVSCQIRLRLSRKVDVCKPLMLGQDPYHDVNQAMGLSFSVPQGQKVPSSLQNIFKELGTDLGCAKPTHGDLDKWATQGQGLTLAHFLAQRKRFRWNRGCI